MINYIKKFLRIITHPEKIIIALGRKTELVPDRLYLKAYYYHVFRTKLDLLNPTTFNEKLQWLKINNRKDIYCTMVDKYEAKEYVSNIIGEEYIIPTLGVWDSFDEIDFDALPMQFVLKCTHDSAGIVIVKDKSSLNLQDTKSKINRCLKRNYYCGGREWPYKNVQHRILAEKYMKDDSTGDLRDYKFFCFNGKVKYYKVDFDRFVCHRANYYDVNDNIMEFGEAICPPDPTKDIVLPKTIEKMKILAEKLSQDCPFLRVDFYDVNGKIYFGELTFYPDSGFGKIIPNVWDEKLGRLINIDNI